MFAIMRWRRCTAYLLIQKSNNKVKYVAYLYDKVEHSATSFGTSCHASLIQDIKAEFVKHKKRLLAKLHKCTKMIQLTYEVSNIPKLFDDKFGLPG